MAESKQNMRNSASFIQSTEVEGSVGHDRVGKLFNDIIDWLGDTPGGGTVYPSPSGNDTYLHWNGSSYNWTKPSGGAQLGGFLSSLNGLSSPSSLSQGYLYCNGSSVSWTGSPGGGGMTEDQMWGYLRSQDTNTNKQINYSHLNNLSWWGNKFNTGTGNTATAITGLIQADYGIRIGGANGVWLTYDSTNKALKVSDDTTKAASAQVAKNFYATGGVSALGYDASGGGGGGGGLTTGNLAEYFDGQTKNGTPNDGEILVYRPNNGGWKFEAKPSGGGGQGGGGTVTSVGLQMPTGFSVSGSPITNSGTFNVGFSNGYSLVDSGDRVNWNGKLNEDTYNNFINNTTWWGQKIGAITSGVVEGDMEAGTAGGAITGFHSLELNTHNTESYHGGFIDFHYKGSLKPGEIKPDYTARIIEDSLGVLHIESMEKPEDSSEPSMQKAGLHVGQNFKDSFVQIGNVKLVYDGDSAIRVEKYDGTAAHFYATGGISALGIQPETTSLDSFRINYLESNTVTVDNKVTFGNGVDITNNTNHDQLIVKAPSSVVVEINGTAKAQIHAFGVQSSRFYLDGTHFLTYKDGALEFFDGTSYKKVVLQDI